MDSDLRRALEMFIRAYEQDENLWTEPTEQFWNAYEYARHVMGDPIQYYPGGYEDQHIHPFGWKPDDGCDPCEDYGNAG